MNYSKSGVSHKIYPPDLYPLIYVEVSVYFHSHISTWIHDFVYILHKSVIIRLSVYLKAKQHCIKAKMKWNNDVGLRYEASSTDNNMGATNWGWILLCWFLMFYMCWGFLGFIIKMNFIWWWSAFTVDVVQINQVFMCLSTWKDI